ncbi:MAG TPA: L,D-transpeptidase family protein, partial [Candidatus Kryptonia bacterium]|nr:L,D-transpeptidase family protein [Candidatus Kryptonia bacterium]
DPENPLGKYRLRLQPIGQSPGDYGIHGTDIPWGVGMQVSHGCIRLYPEDIEQLFPLVSVHEPVQFVYQPVKVGARDGEIYIEVHKDIYRMTPGPYREAQRLLQKYGWTDRVDDLRLRRAIGEQSGVPMLISRDAASDTVVEERFRTRRSPQMPVESRPPPARAQDKTAERP